jgi:3-deoxy-D-manno-octulosonate 8-phosphate phosphatase (KDO 8-P phosphatase)
MSNKIKLLILDCDGVLTNGRKTYNKKGECISKEFCDKDFTAIKRFRAAGVPVCVISGDPWNEQIFINRLIPFFNSRNLDKESFLHTLCLHYNVCEKDIAFVGDDIFDVGLLNVVGYPYVTKDCSILSIANPEAEILNSNGGEHVVVELFKHCVNFGLIEKLTFEEEYKRVKELDKNEKF